MEGSCLQGLLFFLPMETQFYILLSLKTVKGFVNYGQYFIGNDRQAAENLFGEMNGIRIITDSTALHIDLMETVNELPLKVETIGCTLDELSENLKMLTRELFRRHNLDEFN
jgi:hypothetical protein